MGDVTRQLFGGGGGAAAPPAAAYEAIFSSEVLADLFPSGPQQVENEKMHTKREVFHYWTIFKNSGQYLKLMGSQLKERQRARVLSAAVPAWRAAVVAALKAAGLRPGQRQGPAWKVLEGRGAPARGAPRRPPPALPPAPAPVPDTTGGAESSPRGGGGGGADSSGLTNAHEEWSPSAGAHLSDMLNPSANPRGRRRMGAAGRMGAASGYARRSRRSPGGPDSSAGGTHGYRFLVYFEDPYARFDIRCVSPPGR